MLRLFRAHGLPNVRPISVFSHSDEWLIDLAINYGTEIALADRQLTKFRLERKSGALLSVEMRGGLIVGVELLGIIPGRWDRTIERFASETHDTDEIPVHGIELDGRNTEASCDVSAITQSAEFSVQWAVAENAIELMFGVACACSTFGKVRAFYDHDQRLSGMRIYLDAPISQQ